MIKISLEEWVEFLKEKSANKSEYLKNSRNSKGYSCKRKQKGSLSSEAGKKKAPKCQIKEYVTV